MVMAFEIFQKQNDIWHKYRAKLQKSLSENKTWGSRAFYFIASYKVCFVKGHEEEATNMKEAKTGKAVY